MNIIFVDFDGTLDTVHFRSPEQIEEKVKILADICHAYNAKIVIEAAAKDAIDEDTLYVDPKDKWPYFMMGLFKKYNIEVYGRTPNVKKYYDPNRLSSMDMWKEDEIRLFLMRHPEIEHYCVIDDDDLLHIHHRKSDLDKVRNHLLTTNDYNEHDKTQEGILESHMEEIGRILQKDNEVRKLILRYQKN